jgi:hypothetical protein
VRRDYAFASEDDDFCLPSNAGIKCQDRGDSRYITKWPNLDPVSPNNDQCCAAL